MLLLIYWQELNRVRIRSAVVFRRLRKLRLTVPATKRPRLARLLYRLVLMFIGAAAIALILGGFPTLRVLMGLFLSLVLGLFLSLVVGLLFTVMVPALTGTVSGALVAFNVSGALAQERLSGRFEQISVTPIGPLGLALVVGKLSYLYSGLAHFLRRIATGVYLFSAALAAFLILLSVLSGPNDLTILFQVLLLLIMGYYDLIAALALAVLCGALAGIWLRDRDMARLAALTLFLGVQIVTYLCLLLMLQVLSGRLLPLLLVTLLLLREMTFQVMVRALARWLDETPDAFHTAIRLRY